MWAARSPQLASLTGVSHVRVPAPAAPDAVLDAITAAAGVAMPRHRNACAIGIGVAGYVEPAGPASASAPTSTAVLA